MPRDANGLYALPTGNPVVTDTVISSTWANTTLPDLGAAVQDSLSRSGLGVMTAPLRHSAGTVTAPSITFAGEPQTGWYRAAAADVRFAVSGVDAFRVFNGQVLVWSISGGVWVPLITADTAGSVVETDTLDGVQTAVTFTRNVAGAALYVDGTSGDRGRLLLGTDYTYDAPTNLVTLAVVYPVNTKLSAVINDETDVAAAAVAAQASAVAALASENAAAASETAALASENAAATSETNSAASAAASLSSKNASGVSATASAASAAASLSSKNAAGVSETNASNSATAAAASETNASASESAAATSATDAQASADSIVGDVAAASGFADAAEASYITFDERMLGSFATDPTLDNQGGALLTGALYWSTAQTALKVYSGTVWKLATTVVEGVYEVTELTNVAGQTTFTLSYDTGLLQVLYNGVQLALADFTATSGTSIILGAAVASATDVITFIRWGAVTTSTFLGTAATKNTGVATGEVPLADNVVLKDSLTGAGTLPAGTTAERPGTPAVGMVRYNATNAQFEGYGAEWSGLGGSSLGTNSVIRINAKVISENITFAGTENGSSVGPITIDTGYTVTVTTGSTWVIL